MHELKAIERKLWAREARARLHRKLAEMKGARLGLRRAREGGVANFTHWRDRYGSGDDDHVL
jgi:hypothetical protein